MIGLLALGIICFGSIEFLLYALANFGREAKRRRVSFTCNVHSSRGF
jgi:hypothetical protein